jgi:SPP1 family predicted phage head-tail adaptor
MNIGAMRWKIQLQSKSGTGADSDPFVTSASGVSPWTTYYECWAQLKPLTSKEVFEFNQDSMKVSHKITIRYPGPGINISAGDQVLYKTRVFQLQTGLINPDERNISLELLAYEIDPTL